MTKISEETLNKIRSNHSELTQLDLKLKRIDDSDLELLTAALKTNAHLTDLDLSSNDIGPNGARALANTPSLRSLNLWQNGVGDDGAKEFAKSSHLTSLNLSFNFVMVEGAKALSNNTCLKSLDLSMNQIGNEGAKALATNTTLTELNIMICNVEPDGARAFFKNNELFSLLISLNPIDDELLRQLRKSVKANKKAKESKFIGAVIEVAKGARHSQENCWFRKIPNDALLIIFSYLAGYLRTRPEVIAVCRFLLQTIRLTKTGELNWSQAVKTNGFFKSTVSDPPRCDPEYSKHSPDYGQVTITKLISG